MCVMAACMRVRAIASFGGLNYAALEKLKIKIWIVLKR